MPGGLPAFEGAWRGAGISPSAPARACAHRPPQELAGAPLRAAPAGLPSSRAVERPLHSPSLPGRSPGRGGRGWGAAGAQALGRTSGGASARCAETVGGGLCAPKPGLTDARLPAQAHPYLQICTEHPSRERGGRGGAGQGLCPPRSLHRGPGSPHCPFVGSTRYRRETALFVGGSCPPTTPAAPPSQSLGEGPSGPPSPV